MIVTIIFCEWYDIQVQVAFPVAVVEFKLLRRRPGQTIQENIETRQLSCSHRHP